MQIIADSGEGYNILQRHFIILLFKMQGDDHGFFDRVGLIQSQKTKERRGEASEPLEKTLDQAFLSCSPASLLDVNYYSLQLKNFVLSHILVLFSV